jgi:hypothetical protein
MGVAATGNQVEITGMDIWRIEEGRSRRVGLTMMRWACCSRLELSPVLLLASMNCFYPLNSHKGPFWYKPVAYRRSSYL